MIRKPNAPPFAQQLPPVLRNIAPPPASGAERLAAALGGVTPQAASTSRVVVENGRPVREVFAQSVLLPDTAEVSFGKFTRPWRGVDIFATVDVMGAASSAAFTVYAMIGGQRSYVRSGRIGRAFNGQNAAPIHVVSLRSVQAETYELTLSYDDIPAVGARALITAVGSEDALSADDPTVGAIPFAGTALSGTPQVRAVVSPAVLVGLNAVHTGLAGSGPIYVQLGGTNPAFMSFAIPEGGSLYSWDRGLQVYRVGASGSMSARVSSTPAAFTASANGTIIAFLR
jgi:hypothetical protein